MGQPERLFAYAHLPAKAQALPRPGLCVLACESQVCTRVSKCCGVTTTYPVYSDNGELKQIIEGSAITDLFYDDNGNCIRKTITNPGVPTVTWEYAYDTENRLTVVTKDGVVVSANAYDAFGRRVKALSLANGVPGTLTVFIYAGNSVVYEQNYRVPSTILDVSLALAAGPETLIPLESIDYVRANDILVAKLTSTDGVNEVVTYYHQDHLGSTRVQTDAAGELVARADYEPFGAHMQGHTGSEPFAYTGQRDDGATGLYYYGARFYDPAIGRFMTADSWTNLPDDERGYMVGANPGGFNQYAYVLNNPVLYNDPTGHKLAVGSSKDDEDDTLAGEHVWTGNDHYDDTHAAEGYERDQREAAAEGRRAEVAINALDEFLATRQAVSAGNLGGSIFGNLLGLLDKIRKATGEVFKPAAAPFEKVRTFIADCILIDASAKARNRGGISNEQHIRYEAQLVAEAIAGRLLNPAVTKGWELYQDIQGLLGK